MKKTVLTVLIMALGLLLAACSTKQLRTEKLRDVEYVIVKEDHIPEKMMEAIQEKMRKPFKLVFEEEGYLYIGEGYGRQETGGYSIEVAALYETENAIYVQTDLIGPGEEEEVDIQITYPYVVVKIENSDKHVVFR